MMGTLEVGAGKIRKMGNLQRTVLATVGIVGMLAIAAVAPNVFQALPRLMKKKYKSAFRIRTTLGKLADAGYIRFIEQRGKKHVEITEKGRHMLVFQEQRTGAALRTKRRWDKRWRMVVFDIPEKYRGTRVQLRRTMKGAGFFRLQDSVWVFPHDCEDFIALLKADLRVGRNALYVIVEKIENDKYLKEHFDLK